MKAWRTAAIAAIVLAMAGCGAGASDDPNRIDIAASTPLQWPHVWVAEEQDLWADEGLTAEVTLFQEGAQALQSLTAGAVDIATAAPTPLVAALSSGQKLRVVGVTDRWSNWRVVADRSKGIDDIDDLKGKTIGVPLGTAADATLEHFLRENSLTRDDVNIVNVAPPSIVSALATGSVDAVNVWVPHIVNAERELGSNGISFPYEVTSNYLLVTTQAALDENREGIAKALDVFAKANTQLVEDPSGSAEMVAEVAGIDAESLAEIWTNEFTFEVGPPNDAVREEFEDNIDFAKANGVIPQDVEISLDDVFVDLFNE